MQGLLHKIKQNLLKEGHLKRYLLYAIGELALIVVGILLAINLNTMSRDQEVNEKTKTALNRLKEEVKINKEEIVGFREANQIVIDLFSLYIDKKESSIIASPLEMDSIRRKFDRLIIVDSTGQEDGRFKYAVKADYTIVFAELRDVAWETAMLADLTNNFDYGCLEKIIDAYKLQELLEKEQSKLIDMIINEDKSDLLALLKITDQFAEELMLRYDSLLNELITNNS